MVARRDDADAALVALRHDGRRHEAGVQRLLLLEAVLRANKAGTSFVVLTVRRAQREGAWDLCPLNGHLPRHPQPSIRATPHHERLPAGSGRRRWAGGWGHRAIIRYVPHTQGAPTLKKQSMHPEIGPPLLSKLAWFGSKLFDWLSVPVQHPTAHRDLPHKL